MKKTTIVAALLATILALAGCAGGGMGGGASAPGVTGSGFLSDYGRLAAVEGREGLATRKADKTLAQGERITWTDLQGIVAAWAKNFRAQLDQARAYAGS
jgi:hypothetical protein